MMAPPPPPQASSSAPYKLPAAPLIARNLSTLLSNGSTTTASSTLPITSLRDLLTESRPPLLSSDEAQAGSSAASSQPQTQALDALPIIDPLSLLTTSHPPLQAQLHTPQARADLLDLAQGLALALARPKDGVAVAAGVTAAGNSASSSASASAVLSLVESRLLLASCYVVLALLPAAPAENGRASQSDSSSKSDPAARLAQATTQLDVARDELREAQRRHQSQVKMKKKRTEAASSSSLAADQEVASAAHEDESLLTQQLAHHQARLLLASANVAHLSGRPEHEVKRLVGWWAKARGQAQMGKGSGSGAEGTRGDKAEGG